MNILVTGAKGFIGKNLCARLNAAKAGKCKLNGIDEAIEVMEYDVDTPPEMLNEYCKKADFVFNLAGINRPLDQSEFMEENFGFASFLIYTLKKCRNNCPVMISSSVQAELKNPYGLSKKAGEDIFFAHAEQTGAKALVYRFPNVFGKWCRPNYNSAVATFCHNIARNLPITVNDPNTTLTLVYIDDVVDELIRALAGNETRTDKFCDVPVKYTVTLGRITELLYSFKENRKNISVPDLSDAFTKKLHATYLSYVPEDDCAYELKMNCDNRGSFTEIIRTMQSGQFSVNIIKPGIVKGNHWHNTKNEKFLVVSGKGVVRLRKIDSDKVSEYYVCGDKLEVIEILPGYTHNIENLSDTDMVTFMWANESFDPNNPDTFFEPV